MSDNFNSNTGGFLKGKFENCPSCGELISVDADGCRHCNWARGTTHTVQSFEPPHQIHHPVHSPSPAPYTVPCSIPDPEYSGPLYTFTGELIPPEYSITFRPDDFSWPAFWFADLWFAEKGLLEKAKKHFTFRAATAFAIFLGMVLVFGASDSESAGAVAGGIFGGLLMLVWFGGFLVTAALSWNDARTAHREYLKHYNESICNGTFEAARKKGLAMYWNMLYIPFGIFMFAFFIMLMSVSLD